MTAEPTTAETPSRRPERRRWWLIGGAAALVVIVVAVLLLVIRPGRSDSSGITLTATSVPCGGDYCFPGGAASQLRQVLTAAGYHCDPASADGPYAVSCYIAGVVAVDLNQGPGANRIAAMNVSVPTRDVTPDNVLARLDQALGLVLPALLPGATAAQQLLTRWPTTQTHRSGPCPVQQPQTGGYQTSCLGPPWLGGDATKVIINYRVAAVRP
jgi:hypothetical protein